MKKFLEGSLITYNSLLFLFLASLLLGSCGSNNVEQEQGRLIGGAYRGGTFSLNEVSEIQSLFPLNVTDVTSFRTANQIYEGLVKFDQKDLSILPCLAEKWEISDDAKTFTFHIRKGVKFHDNSCFDGGDGREVTAEDFVYCFNNLCKSSPQNQMFWLFDGRVSGASKFYDFSIANREFDLGVSGVTALDKYTIQIKLEAPFSGFLNVLAHPGCWVYPKEAFQEYGKEMNSKAVGTGPFKLDRITDGKSCSLIRNPNYWKKDSYDNQLPYLNGIKISFVNDKTEELKLFKEGKLDMIFKLPFDKIDHVLGELDDAKKGDNLPFEMQVTPSMLIQYYGFQHTSGVFKNKNVRLAFNYAIDRDYIVDFILQGDGKPVTFGFVPPAFSDYEYDSLKSYSFSPKKARLLLSKGGFPLGKGFPKLQLQLNSGGLNNVRVAEAIQEMLKENLNIDIELLTLPFAEHLELIENGTAKFWRSGWAADYPDPESFLNLFYGKHVPDSLYKRSYINSFRYKSARYDSLYELALQTIDKTRRYRLYRLAEQTALDDAVILPLYYDEFIRLLSPEVRNFPSNAMEYRDFSKVYLEPEDS